MSMHPDLDAQKSPVATDRRRHPRYRFSVPITIYATDGLIIPGISIEISASGISAISASPLKINETVDLAPIANGTVLACVRHNVGKVYGFEFLNLTPDQTQQIIDKCRFLPLYRGKSLGI